MLNGSDTLKTMGLFIIIGILGRIIPHSPNMTPLISLCLLAGVTFSRKLCLSFLFITAVLSDLLLAYIQGYPAYGPWMLFTYSGFIAIALAGAQLSTQPRLTKSLIYALSSALGFWIWTNFGTWLLSGIYAKSIAGLISCYAAALPFLSHSLLGTTAWLFVLWGGLYMTTSRHHDRLTQPL
jgi:hypothetical protein